MEQQAAIAVWEDNAACILLENPVNRKFTWHIDVRSYFCKDLVRDGVMLLCKCAGTHNVADALTKSLPSPAFSKHRPWLIGTAEEYKTFTVSFRAVLPGSGVAAAA